MKKILSAPAGFLLFLLFAASPFTLLNAQDATGWTTDFKAAKEQAQKENKCILLNFSGSDWCGPCIKLHKDILSAPTFLDYASHNLVLVNADFPRMKKNKQDKVLEEQNEQLADRYNKEGKFPLTILLNKDLKILKVWDGYPHFSLDEYSTPPQQFTEQIKEILTGYAAH